MERTESATLAVVKRRALVAAIVGFFLGGTLPGVLGLVALSVADSHPRRAETLTGVAWLLMIVGWLLLAAFLLLGSGGGWEPA